MADRDSTLTQQRLKELLDYNAETGVFTWRVDRGTNKTAGKQAGTIRPSGLAVISIDGRDRYAHILAWLYVHGVLLEQKALEWINGDIADNRIANLRIKTKSADREITLERVRNELDYDADTGVFRWKIRPVNSIQADDIAGALDKAGYLRIKIGNRNLSAHRLAWFYVNGVWPDGEIDHINGVRNDNRISNLRVVTRQGNVHNRHKSWSASGLMGVYGNSGKWRAAISVDGKMMHIGNFATPEEAHSAYLEAKRRLHPTSTL